MEQEGYTFLEDKFHAASPGTSSSSKIPGDKTLLGIPSKLSMIGISAMTLDEKDKLAKQAADRKAKEIYSGLAICYKEQIADGRQISIKELDSKLKKKKLEN